MDVSSLSNQELRKCLVQFGENPGPVVATTRSLYEKKLKDLLAVIIHFTLKHNSKTFHSHLKFTNFTNVQVHFKNVRFFVGFSFNFFKISKIFMFTNIIWTVFVKFFATTV